MPLQQQQQQQGGRANATPTTPVATPTPASMAAEEPVRLEFGQIRVKKEPGLEEPEDKEPLPPKVNNGMSVYIMYTSYNHLLHAL